MTDMIERGKAKFREIALQYGWTETAGEDYAFVPAILLAALDPEDEALQFLWTEVLDRFSDPTGHHCMSTFFAELKASIAQGERRAD